MTPDLEMAACHLAALDPAGVFTFQIFDDDQTRGPDGKRPDGRPALARLMHGTLEARAAELARLSLAGAGVFVCVNATDLKGRQRRNCVQVRAWSLDVDDCSYEEAVERVRAFGLVPSLVVRAKRGGHFYFLAAGASLADFPRVQTALALTLGGDLSLKDPVKVLRLAGFPHRKDPANPVMVTLEQARPEIVHTQSEIVTALGGWTAVDKLIADHEAARAAVREAERAARAAAEGRSVPAARPSRSANKAGSTDDLQRAVESADLAAIVSEFWNVPRPTQGGRLACRFGLQHSTPNSLHLIRGDEDDVPRLYCHGSTCSGRSSDGVPLWNAYDFLVDARGAGMTPAAAVERLKRDAGLWKDYTVTRSGVTKVAPNSLRSRVFRRFRRLP